MSALTDDPRTARVALTCLVEPGHRELGMLVDRCGPVQALIQVLRGDVDKRLVGAVEARRAQSRGDFVGLAERALEATERMGARIVTPDDDEWPIQLGDLRRISQEDGGRVDRDTYPPLCVWVRGTASLAAVARRSVAMVGARASTAYGNHIAMEFAYGLAERGWCVVSGGAYGIDAQAHRGALGPDGATIAVMACGIDKTYPQAHAALFERITADGLLLSEWPPGADPHQHRFLVRNRVIAALARGTVVVEASARSGAKQTANRTRALGRVLMAVPGPITSAMSVGSHHILREMEGRVVTSVDEVVEEVGLIGEDLAPIPRGPERPRDRLDPDLARVLDGVPARKAADPQQIAASAGMSLRAVLRALPVLRDGEFVVEEEGGWRIGPRARARG